MPEQSPVSEKQDDILRIFISHKKEDEKIAEGIHETFLDIGGAARTIIFVMARIPPGVEWPKEVRKALREADRLILVHTDAEKKSDWCLYEAGYFHGHGDQIEYKKRPPICLHRPGIDIPEPLKQYQCIQAKKSKVAELILDLFATEPRPGVPKLRPEYHENHSMVKKKAREIVHLFKPPRELLRREWFTYYLLLSLTNDNVKVLQNTYKVPDSTRVESDKKSLALFGLRLKNWTWGDIKRRLGTGVEQIGWISSLDQQLANASRDWEFQPMLPYFRLKNEHHGRRFQPVIHRIDIMSDQSLVFNILFSELYAVSDPAPMGDIGILGEMLTMGRTFRWGVIQKYMIEIDKLVRQDQPTKIGRCLRDLKFAIERAEIEAAAFGFLIKSRVKAAFRTEEEKREIDNLYEKWRVLRENIMTANSTSDLDQVRNNLEEMWKMNLRFMLLTVNRYKALLEASA